MRSGLETNEAGPSMTGIRCSELAVHTNIWIWARWHQSSETLECRVFAVMMHSLESIDGITRLSSRHTTKISLRNDVSLNSRATNFFGVYHRRMAVLDHVSNPKSGSKSRVR